MSNFFDIGKVKTWKLGELVGRRLKIDRFTDDESGTQLIIAFDTKSYESFILGSKVTPVAIEAKRSADGVNTALNHVKRKDRGIDYEN